MTITPHNLRDTAASLASYHGLATFS